MRRYTPVILAILISLGIRLMLVVSAQGISLAGYQAILHIDRIMETGLPLMQNALGWGGSTVTTMPLFYYLLAFLDLFFPRGWVLLGVPNLLLSLLPIPVYLIASEISKQRSTIALVTIASVFIPVLYQRTALSVTPLSLALPLLLLAYYFFIRLEKTPRDQTLFAITVVALTLTHPISLLLPVAMAITLVLLHIQRLGTSRPMAEAAIFTAFLTIWANSITYKYALQSHGIAALWTAVGAGFSITALPGLVGIIALFGGVFGAFRALTAEHNVAMHAMTGLAIAATTAAILGLFHTLDMLLLLSTLLILLAAHAVDALFEARYRARVRGVHTGLLAILLVLFILTSGIPSIALGVESFGNVPDTQEERVLDVLEQYPQRNTYWDAPHGYYLEANGVRSAVDSRPISHPRGPDILQDLHALDNQTSEIRVLDILTRHDIHTLVLNAGHDLPLGERCFTPLLTQRYEVYRVRCVVQ